MQLAFTEVDIKLENIIDSTIRILGLSAKLVKYIIPATYYSRTSTIFNILYNAINYLSYTAYQQSFVLSWPVYDP